ADHGDTRLSPTEHGRQHGHREQPDHDDHEADPETLELQERLHLAFGDQAGRRPERGATRLAGVLHRAPRRSRHGRRAHQMASLKISSNEGSTGVKLRTAPLPSAAFNTSWSLVPPVSSNTARGPSRSTTRTPARSRSHPASESTTS